MQFYFSYPMSETQSYYLLQDCLVALYYQMYFLYYQCYSDRTDGEGWGYCKYGDQVECDDCKSWICPEAVESGKEYAEKVKAYNAVKDKKNEVEKQKKELDKAWQNVINQQQCGTSNPSPLQAFLTDCLKGFTCEEVVKHEASLKKLRSGTSSTTDKNKIYSECYPEFLEHRGHTKVFGQECAVPMGFSGSFKGARGTGSPGVDGMIGLGLEAVLDYYSNDDVYSSGLYQITRCISSLTRRVPRSTGTLYGFFYGLVDVYHSKKGNFNTKLEEELECCPGWRNTKGLMGALMGWTESDHSKKHTKKDQGNPTLGSLYRCKNEAKDGKPSCGYYLQTLTGSMYKCVSDSFCETYVSWIVHLTYRLHEGLRSLLESFGKIDCSNSGCTGSGGKGKCDKQGCRPSTHGVVNKEGNPKNTDGCCCKTVVHCAGVLPMFYRFGFCYTSAWAVGLSPNWKKTCKQFSEQLGKVITEGLFTKLQEQLRKFIYSTRALFGVYIGVYWSIVLVYLLWSMTVNLDLMHIQSHWRSPGSYLVPLQRILADGSRNVKRVCTIGYFQENSGDSLLSQGVSDVYL